MHMDHVINVAIMQNKIAFLPRSVYTSKSISCKLTGSAAKFSSGAENGSLT